MKEIENEIFERTTLNATARVLKHDEGKYSYEVVFGILPIDDVFRYESGLFLTAKNAAESMMFNFNTHVENLFNNEV